MKIVHNIRNYNKILVYGYSESLPVHFNYFIHPSTEQFGHKTFQTQWRLTTAHSPDAFLSFLDGHTMHLFPFDLVVHSSLQAWVVPDAGSNA